MWWGSLVLLGLTLSLSLSLALPDQGRWDLQLTQKNNNISIPKSLFKGSQIFILVTCNGHPNPVDISIKWSLTQSICWTEVYQQCESSSSPDMSSSVRQVSANNNRTVEWSATERCTYATEHIHIPPYNITNKTAKGTFLEKIDDHDVFPQQPNNNIDPVYTVTNDGIYTLKLSIDGKGAPFNVSVTIKMRGTYGYLSAVDWPYLPFYGTMCSVYVVLGTAWLIVCWLQWRDILRIQFWIGAVVLLGMLEKATFYAEYSSINSSGIPTRGAVLAAEWVSVAKRALARMLVIIVSLGFGIVKPRLGPMLQRVVGIGVLWGALAALEAYLRIGGRMPVDGSYNENETKGSNILLAAAPLALLDAAFCWWIFASLLNTTRTLRLRRNMVKLSLYKHFTNTLIFAVLSSVFFMLYSIKAHCLAECLANWKELWIDEGYWHILFSIVLLVIMILWRPTNNNQRYAFTPLLDNADDDDEEEEHFVSDAYGVKIRSFTRTGSSSNGSNLQDNASNAPLTPAQREEADLKWVEDNIPTSSLPILDSDEEIINAKFEVSKMQ